MSDFVQAGQPLGTSVAGPFCDAGRVVRSWYVVMPGAKLRPGRVRGIDMLGRRVAVWREAGGQVHAIDARCPHLGADLSQGRVVGDALRCAFHHWRFDGEGQCVDAPCEADIPQRSARAYTVAEKHGLIWLYNGESPAFDLPDFDRDDPADRYRRVRIKPLHLECHPHLAIANGLDAAHLDKLHGLDFTQPPTLQTLDQYRLRLTIQGRPRSPWVRWITATGRKEIKATFTTIGSSSAWLTFTHPLRFHTLFTARPDQRGQTDTQTLVFLPRGFGFQAIRSAATLLSVLHADRPVLNSIRFHPGFTDADHTLRAYAQQINAMEVDQ